MNEEMIAKLKEVKSAEDVIAIAKEYGKELTLEQAQALCDKLKASANGELTDEELAGVAGGGIDWGYVSEQMSKYGPDVVKALESLM